MKTKKRTKASRHRGTHTHGRGAKKKARGKGHRGGIGMSGSGKRGDQKKTLITKKYGGDYFGKDKVRRGPRKKFIKTITVQRINENIESLMKKGIAKEENGFYVLDLKGYKLVGDEKFSLKVKVKASNASKGALKSLKESGGEFIKSKISKEERE